MSSINTNAPKENPVRQVITPGYKHHRVVPMLQLHEDKELHLPMVVLTGSEQSEVESRTYQDTLEQFKGKPPKADENSNWDQLLEANRAYWTVFYSARLPNDLKKKWFESKRQVEDTYNWDEIGILMNHYMTVRLTQPHLINIDPNDPNAMQTVIDRIKTLGGESDFFLNGLITHNVNQLIKYLVAHQEILPKDNGSSGTP